MSINGIGGSNGFDPSQMTQNFFTKADADGSGGIDKSELATMLSNGPGGGKQDIDGIFAEVDTDGDGTISESENAEQMSKMANGAPPPPPAGGGGAPPPASGSSSSESDEDYDVMDANKDGVVSAQEELAYYREHPEEAIKKQNEMQKNAGYDREGNHNGYSDSLLNLNA